MKYTIVKIKEQQRRKEGRQEERKEGRSSMGGKYEPSQIVFVKSVLLVIHFCFLKEAIGNLVLSGSWTTWVGLYKSKGSSEALRITRNFFPFQPT